MDRNENKAKRFLLANGWRQAKGFAFDTKAMNPDDYGEIFFEGKTIQKAIEDYVRKVDYWIYNPSGGEQIEEDIWDAVEYTESECGATFAEFK